MEKESAIACAAFACSGPSSYLVPHTATIRMSQFPRWHIRTALRRVILSAGLLLAVFPAPGGNPPVQRLESGTAVTIPAGVVEVYRHVVNTGRAPVGYIGGRAWYNREHRLPSGGRY